MIHKGGEIMAQSQAHIRAANKYNAKAYRQLNFRVKIGESDRLKAYADSQGMSLNNFVCSCLSYCIKHGIDVSSVPALTETLPDYVEE